MNRKYINRIIHGDCRDHLPRLDDESIDLLLSDIPYGIGLDDWDVLHANSNSALLGQSPAQAGKSGFKRRGKPINGWSQADRNIGREYQDWCSSWSSLVYAKMKPGASLFIFGARRTLHRGLVALEDSGFLLKDVLARKKPCAHHRAQAFSGVLHKRGLSEEAGEWEGWRLGNLAPMYEPIAWLFKPYDKTLTDNILQHGVGGINIDGCKIDGVSPSNVLDFKFAPTEVRLHEAQKPEKLIEFLIMLSTREGQVVLDPFIGSGTTAVCAKKLRRRFVGFELIKQYHVIAEDRIKRTNLDS